MKGEGVDADAVTGLKGELRKEGVRILGKKKKKKGVIVMVDV